jgi:hypothetical protein
VALRPGDTDRSAQQFFALIDYETLYEVAQEYSDTDLSEVETPSGKLNPVQ